jgi:hypothetical protein
MTVAAQSRKRREFSATTKAAFVCRSTWCAMVPYVDRHVFSIGLWLRVTQPIGAGDEADEG